MVKCDRLDCARGHLRVSRFARRTTEKRETARSLANAIRVCLKQIHPKFFLREISKGKLRWLKTLS